MLDEKAIAIRIGQILRDDPIEHDWALDEDEVLIELVRDFIGAPDFAGSALSELSDREHEVVGDLCLFLLAHQEADRWLKFQAVMQLPATHMENGFDILLDLIHRCDAETLALLVHAIHVVLERDLPMAVRNHPLIGKINSLASHGDAIYFAGSLTREEFIQADKLTLTTPFWKALLIMAGWALGTALMAFNTDTLIPGVLMLMLGLALIWFGWGLKKISIAWDHIPDCREHVFGTISEDGIDVYGEDFWRFTAWSKLKNWNASDDMLIVLSPSEARALPPSFFADSTAWCRAQTICVTKLPPLPRFKLL